MRRAVRSGIPIALVVAVLIGVGIYALSRGGADPSDEAPIEEEEEDAATDPELRMPLTGVVTDAIPERPALIVKVSNSPEARPQTGLDEADLVYEEVTEGGITRFIAVFHSQLPAIAGPVRSARPVDTQVIAGFGRPGFAYSGARDEVRELLARTRAAVITEGDPGFFRDGGEHASHPFAPHNLFVRLDEAMAAVTAGDARPLGDLGWAFADEPPDGSAGPGETLEVVMSDAFVTSWTYDAEAGVYRRQQNGADATVTGTGRIGAANVVVLDVRHYIGPSGYPETDVLGDGAAIVLRDGQRYAARWSKPAATDPLRILTADGADAFPLKPGPTWIHLPDELPPTTS